MPQKDESPPSTTTAVVQGLNVAPNPDISSWQQWGPMAMLIIWAIGAILLGLDIIPNPDPVKAVVGALVGPVLAWAAKLGATG